MTDKIMEAIKLIGPCGLWFLIGAVFGTVYTCIHLIHQRDDLYEEGIRIGLRRNRPSQVKTASTQTAEKPKERPVPVLPPRQAGAHEKQKSVQTVQGEPVETGKQTEGKVSEGNAGKGVTRDVLDEKTKIRRETV